MYVLEKVSAAARVPSLPNIEDLLEAIGVLFYKEVNVVVVSHEMTVASNSREVGLC